MKLRYVVICVKLKFGLNVPREIHPFMMFSRL